MFVETTGADQVSAVFAGLAKAGVRRDGAELRTDSV